MTTPVSSRRVVRLDLGADSSRVWVEEEGRSNELVLPIGTSDVSALFLRDPPRETELEAAIDVVEEAVMPLAKLIPPQAILVAGNASARQLVGLSTGTSKSRAAALDAIEAQFELLALAARRGAWTGENHPAPALSAGLLILREFMHHIGFDRIELDGSTEVGRSTFGQGF